VIADAVLSGLVAAGASNFTGPAQLYIGGSSRPAWLVNGLIVALGSYLGDQLVPKLEAMDPKGMIPFKAPLVVGALTLGVNYFGSQNLASVQANDSTQMFKTFLLGAGSKYVGTYLGEKIGGNALGIKALQPGQNVGLFGS
jgi:hypothetical protein